MYKTKLAVQIAISLILIVLFLGFTNPFSLPLVMLLVPFALLFWLGYSVALLLFILITGHKSGSTQHNQTKGRLFAVIFGLITVLFFVLQSINQLTFRDVLIVSGLMLVLGFYLRRFK